MSRREQLLAQLAGEIRAGLGTGILRVGIDGVDGAGKSCFAAELAHALAPAPLICASVDGFHNPRARRYARGRGSPAGFYHDSYNYAGLKAALLDPLSPGGNRRYRTAIFDHEQDAAVAQAEKLAEPPLILLFEGIFLHRPELRDYWDYSIFLYVSPAISVARCLARAGTPDVTPDPTAPEHRRYVEGQALYLAACQPEQRATHVINNEQLEAPFIVSRDPDAEARRRDPGALQGAQAASRSQRPGPDERCPDCGALHADGRDCRAWFDECLALEFSDPAYGAVHHLTVLSYMLQHNGYSAAVWPEAVRLLARFVEDGAEPAAMRPQVAELARAGSVTGGPGPDFLADIVWRQHITSLALNDPARYGDSVRAWAAAVLADCRPYLER
ncbi:MAG: hypothetical protein KDE59_29355 [Anaerolineales bacterium]|nr:hypothetical protein [Anaerolineales bacterium]